MAPKESEQAGVDLEREKLREDVRLRELELGLKKSEFERSRWSSPLVLAILGAALAGIANGGLAWWTSQAQRAIEESKASAAQALEKEKAESARILEMIKTNDTEKAAGNLQFLLDAGLVQDKDHLLRNYLAARKPGQGPVLASSYAPSSFSDRYEPGTSLGNMLGNTEAGDGAKFKGRGYLQLTGRRNYDTYSKRMENVDLVAHPELLEKSDVAAKVLALWFKDHEQALQDALSKGDLSKARIVLNGGAMGAATIASRYKVYLAALDKVPQGTNTIAVEGVPPDWLTTDVPNILAALRTQNISDKSIQAYALATADYETRAGRAMYER